MVSAAEQNRNVFAMQFNQLLGTKLGKPFNPVSDAVIANRIPQADLLKAALMSAKKKAPAAPKKATVTPTKTPTDAATLLGLTGSKKSKVDKIDLQRTPAVDRPDIPKKSEGFSLGGLVGGIKHGIGNVAGYVGLSDDEPTSASGPDDSASAFDFLHQVNQGAATQWAIDKINRPFDVTQRAGYAANAAGLALGHHASAQDVWRAGVAGFEGKHKASGEEILSDEVPDWMMHPLYKKLFGMGIDAAENPLSYIKGGTVKASRSATAAELRSGEAATGLGAYKQEYGKAVEEGLDGVTTPEARAALDKNKVTKINKGRIVGTKTVNTVQEPTLNVAEPGKYYHGSSSAIPEFTQYTGKSADNLYGPGVYTTDTGSIAGKYTSKGAGGEPNVYRVEWAGDNPPKVLNLEKPSPDMHSAISQTTEGLLQSEWFDSSVEAINNVQEKLADPTTKAKDLYQAFRTMLADGRMHSAEADDIMHDLNGVLRDQGYDGFTHVGGELTKGQRHGVTVWLNPADIRIAENVTDSATPRVLSHDVPERVGGSVERRSARERVVKNSQDALDQMIYEEKSGRTIGGGPKDTHGTLASSAAEDFRSAMIDDIQPTRNKFVNAASAGKRFSTAEFAKMRAKDPMFGKWLDAAEEVQTEAAAAGQRMSTEEIARLADAKFSENLTPMVNEVRSNIRGNLQDRITRVGRISLGRHDVYLPKLSRMVQDLKLGDKIPENFRRAYLMSSWLPGYTGHVSNKMRSVSKLELNSFKAELEAVAGGTTLAERKLIKSATEADIQLTGKLGEIQAKQVEMYKQMYDTEIENGVRSAEESPYVANYTFNRIKGGQYKLPDGNLERGWIEPRKKSMKANKSSAGWTAADAKGMGLKVEEDFADALVQRKVRSLNKLTKTHLTRDLVSHYGIKSRMPMAEAFTSDLTKIDPHNLPLGMEKELKPGEHIYLHKDIAKVIDDYNDLMSFNQTKEARNFVKGVENLTQIYKVANTMYWPGFHMRNMLSDFFMGMLDGVKAREYPEIFQALLSREDPHLNIGGETVRFSKLQDSYLRNASSGYFDAETSIKTHPDHMQTSILQDSVRPYEMPEQLKAVGDFGKKIHSKVSNMSQAREDLGRLVHYKHAMDEEYAFNRAKGFSKEKSWANAEEAAQARVNRFKFDYDALTPWEKKLRKYGIPFYTYMRKATPVLLENMLMNPRYFGVMSRLQQQMQPTEEWQNTKEPTWMREQNFSQLTDGTQPWGFTDALNPTRTVTDAMRMAMPLGTKNRQAFASNLAPGLQLPFEIAFGKDVFSGKPTNNIGDFLKNKWKGTSQYGSLTGPKTPLEKGLYAAGLPVYQVTDRLQATKGAELKHTLQDTEIAYNKQLLKLGVKIEINNGKLEIVQPKSPTAQEEADGTTPKYPPNKKRKVLGTYNSFDEIPIKFKQA